MKKDGGQSNIDRSVIIVDNWFYFKIVLIIVYVALFIGLCAFLILNSEKMPKANSLCILVSFFVALIFGYFVINVLKVVLMAMIARAMYEELDDESETQLNCF